MNALYQRITDLVVITFGITPPRPGQEKTAALFILGIVFLLACLIVGGMFVVLHYLH